MVGYIFEPRSEELLDVILPYYIQYQVFQMILDARASEHSARMVAMKNATDKRKSVYQGPHSRVQQDASGWLTTELLEIATAQMALGANHVL